MILDFLFALITAGLAVGAVTFGLVFWAMHRGFIDPAAEDAQDSDGTSNDKKSKKGADSTALSDFLHRKWLKFGGGFYGVVAIITYAVVEFGELADFFSSFSGFQNFFQTISLNMLIRLAIDSLMNFVIAISWPAYWIAELRGQNFWVWPVAAYLGYLAGERLAEWRHTAGNDS